MERIGNVLSVGNVLDNAVFLAELLDLQTAEVFGGRAVNRVKMPVLFLELLNTLVDELHRFQRKIAVLGNGFLVGKLFQLVQRGYTEGSGRGFKKWLDFVVNAQMSAQEAALAVSKRICRRFHLAEIFVGAAVDTAD